MNSNIILFLLVVGLVFAWAIRQNVKRARGDVRGDAKAIAEWDNLSRMGFRRYALLRVVPFVFLVILVRELIRHWQESHAFAVTSSMVLLASLLSLPIGLLAAKLRWSSVDSAAYEARARRRSRNQAVGS